MTTRLYILVDGRPVVEPDVMKWAAWMHAKGNAELAKDKIGETVVRTLFLGIDLAFGLGKPILFETIVYDPDGVRHTYRYCEREEAIEGHERLCLSAPS